MCKGFNSGSGTSRSFGLAQRFVDLKAVAEVVDLRFGGYASCQACQDTSEEAESILRRLFSKAYYQSFMLDITFRNNFIS